MIATSPNTTETAIIVGVITPDTSRWAVRDNLNELEQLARTAGAVVVERVTQSRTRIDPATFIGSGKVKEIKRLVSQHDADLVIFDDDLAPVQVRNIERKMDAKLLDRSGLILDIFAGRAQTAAAKTQVELAQLQYLRTRLTRRWTHLSRQKGGIGTKGPGETQIETDRRLIDKRIATLREKLEKIDQQRTTQRKARHGYTQVSLVGYTNAGKSTLMNAMADESVHAEDQLFATLDATTRNITLGGTEEVLLSDTVGFIRKLPHRLIESFKSTLDEVRTSDLLLHVIDVTHPRFEDHMRVVDETLDELDAHEIPRLLVFNKVDALDDTHLLRALRRDYPNAVFVSALRGIGVSALQDELLDLIRADYVERMAVLPVTEPELIAQIHRETDVLSEEYVYTDAENGAAPQAVARIQYRSSEKHDQRLVERIEALDFGHTEQEDPAAPNAGESDAAESGDAESGDAESEGAESEGAESGAAGPDGTQPDEAAQADAVPDAAPESDRTAPAHVSAS